MEWTSDADTAVRLLTAAEPRQIPPAGSGAPVVVRDPDDRRRIAGVIVRDRQRRDVYVRCINGRFEIGVS